MPENPASPLVAPVSGLQLIRQIKSGELDKDAALARFAETHAQKEDDLNCFVEADYARDDTADGPLCGLPLGVKDIIDTSDFPTCHGSPIYAGNTTRADASCVAMARAAGARIVGKTVTTEFAFFMPRGTKNPWNVSHSPGGSSSGSAAGVAAGMFPYALGTQTGGSVVRPASFCGVAGFKPSFDLIPTHGSKPFSPSLDTVGVFAATVEDCAYLSAFLTGRPLHQQQERPPSIAVVRTAQWDHATSDMRSALEHAASLARDAGAEVVERDLPAIFARAFEAHTPIQDFEAARALAWEWANHRDQMSPILQDTLAQGADISPDAYDSARRIAKAARLALMEVFRGIDVILTPSAEGVAPAGLETTGRPTFNRLWTLMGVPCVNVPGLTAPNGLPLGIQVVGPAMSDSQTLAAAGWLERTVSITR